MKPEVKIVVGGLLLVVGAGSVIGGNAIKKANDRKEVEDILLDGPVIDDELEFQSWYGVPSEQIYGEE